MSPTGAGYGAEVVLSHDTTGGWEPADPAAATYFLIAITSWGTSISDDELVQFGMTVTVVPVAAFSVARIVAPVVVVDAISAPDTIDGRNWTFATPMNTPFRPGAPAMSGAVMASKLVWNCAWVLTMPGDTPATGTRKPVSPAWRTSLLPIQIDAKVGFARSACWTCDLPLRMIWVSVFDATVEVELGSSTRAPG